MHRFFQTFEEVMFIRQSPWCASAETILFIHGLGESGLCFEKLAVRSELSTYNLLLPDLPGYGRSPWAAEEPTALAMGRQQFLRGGFDALRESIFNKGIDGRVQRGYYVSLRLADSRSYYHHSEDLVKLSAMGNLASRLGRLQVPVFYIAGMPGGVSNPSRRLLQAAGITLKDIEKSGHWPFIDQEDEFILALLESLPSE